MVPHGTENACPVVTLVSITYNQCDLLAHTLSDLFTQDYPAEKYRIVVLDDGSTDGTDELLRAAAARSPVPFRVLSVPHEADYLTARRYNQCVAAADPRTEVFVQAEDVRLRSDFIRRHAGWHALPGNVIVTGSKFEGPKETWSLSDCQRGHLAGPGGSASRGHPFTAVWGASMSFTRRAMDRACHRPEELPFDELMTGWGYHEVEFACRMVAAGCEIAYDPAVGVFHRNHTARTESLRGLDRERLVREGTQRNEAYLVAKHALSSIPRW